MKKTNQKPSPAAADDLARARAVLEIQVKGLQALSDSLTDNFSSAVDCLAAVRGRVIVTGMGKSGHVARKIAATMASTGTPAHFVHPSEASHGDLGMITTDDAVLALSNSGETQELRDIIGHTRRFSIPLIAVVRRSGSMLVEAADIALVLPEIPEASPTGAPTTSTTMMMALGDALAMALLERAGFTPEHFGELHPGGRLGRAFVRVRDLMHGAEDLPLVKPEDKMHQVLLVMTAGRFGCAGVVDKQSKLLGIVTDGDLRRHMRPDLLDLTASEVMTPQPVTIAPTALAAEALGIMNRKSITSLMVEEDGRPVGILHIHDCLRAGVM